MIYLHYLRENTTKISKNKQKLAIKTVRSADFRSTVMPIVPPAQESSPGNVKGGRDLTKYCTPNTDSVIIVRSSTGV